MFEWLPRIVIHVISTATCVRAWERERERAALSLLCATCVEWVSTYSRYPQFRLFATVFRVHSSPWISFIFEMRIFPLANYFVSVLLMDEFRWNTAGFELNWILTIWIQFIITFNGFFPFSSLVDVYIFLISFCSFDFAAMCSTN